MTLYNNLRLSVTSFGLGILLLGTVRLWDAMLVPYKILAVGLLAFTLYSCLSFATTSQSKHANCEK